MNKLFKECFEARKILAGKLGLPYSDQMQDWEYEVSNPSRLLDFIAEYEKPETSNAEKISLMEIILDSFNSALSDKFDAQQIDQTNIKIFSLLKNNKTLHMTTLEYWQNGWPISYLIKNI